MSKSNLSPNLKYKNQITVIVSKFIKGFFPGMTTLENQPVVAKSIIHHPVPNGLNVCKAFDRNATNG